MKTFLPAVLTLFTLGCIIGHCTACSSPPPKGIENAAAVTQYALMLDDCKAKGKAAHSYAVYEACADELDRHLCREAHLRCLPDGGAP